MGQSVTSQEIHIGGVPERLYGFHSRYGYKKDYIISPRIILILQITFVIRLSEACAFEYLLISCI